MPANRRLLAVDHIIAVKSVLRREGQRLWQQRTICPHQIVFTSTTLRRLIAEPMVISADDDEATTEQTEKILNGVRAELRDGDRLVMRHLAG